MRLGARAAVTPCGEERGSCVSLGLSEGIPRCHSGISEHIEDYPLALPLSQLTQLGGFR